MGIEPSHGRITEQDASASIGLQAVLVGVNYQGISHHHLVEYASLPFIEVRCHDKIPAICCIHMHPAVVFSAKGYYFIKGIKRPCTGCTKCGHHCTGFTPL